ncbi:fibrinogen silencer-binding protein-like [Lepisosteus oculatus]|uniref:fibrinogen silencer-binding protein-like n=1 Tax=Lepisosteus oculatus TaxID=7918 RepID=UPI0035F52DA1
MVGKARSSNFTQAEKLDLLRLLQPHVKVIEENKHRHATILEKNRRWERIAESYNALVGGSRPARTAQGLRTLYKRLKENAKQELVQQRRAQPAYRRRLSETTASLLLLVPSFFQGFQGVGTACLNRFSAGQSGDPERHEIPRSRTWPHFHTASLLGPGSTGAHSEEGPRPATRGAGSSEESAHAGADAVRESPAMHCPSSASVTLTSSPSSPALSPPTEVLSSSPTVDGPLQGVPGRPRQKSLRLTREELEAKLENQRRLGLYIRLKREGLRKRQQLEEELLWARIKVEKLRAARLKRGLPELNCC